MRICFVCLGNICRSPTAEGVMRHIVTRAGLDQAIEVDSAGTAGWHAGELPDPRTRAAAHRRGVDLIHRARPFRRDDFARFELVMAMDLANRRALVSMAPDDLARAKVHLLRSFDAEAPRDAEVPDPYYGDDAGFDHVYDVCLAACEGLLAHLQARR